MQISKEFVRFLTASPTVFHAAQEVCRCLKKGGFSELDEGEKWELQRGKSYFVSRKGSLVAAFSIPEKKINSSIVLASHLDSPALKIKPHPDAPSHQIGRFKTESYGGPLLHTWLDRDLVLAGRVSVLGKSKEIETHLVYFEEKPLFIPSLAIHLDRSVVDKGLLIQKENHLRPIFSLNAKETDLEELLKKHFKKERVYSADLFLVPKEKPSFLGFDQEFLSGYRLDNLSSAYGALFALLKAKLPKDRLAMALFWDHEEIGSKTETGADSLFAAELFERIFLSLQLTKEDLFQVKSKSFALSLDVTHGFHPNFAEKYDLENTSFLGKGPVFKLSAAQKSANTSLIAAPLIYLAEKKKIPVQTAAMRSDLGSGSTLGSAMAATLGMGTIDLGISLWAMHSTRETMANRDLVHLIDLLKSIVEE